jgi:hypothetical protein
MRKNPDRGSGIRDEHPEDTVLKFFDAVPDPGSENGQPWIRDGNIQIRTGMFI